MSETVRTLRFAAQVGSLEFGRPSKRVFHNKG